MTAPALVRRIGGLELTIRWRWLGLLRFVPGGALLGASGWDGTVRAWDVTSGRERACVRTSLSAVGTTERGAALIDHGGRVLLWDAERGAARPHGRSIRAELDGVPIAIDPAARYVAGCAAGREIVLASLERDLERRLALPGAIARSVSPCFSRDGRLLHALQDGTLRTWDVERGEIVGDEPLGASASALVGRAPDGRLGVLRWDGKQAALELRGEGGVERVPLPRAAMSALALAGHYALVADGKALLRIDLRSGAITGRVPCAGTPHRIAISPEGALAAWGWFMQARVHLAAIDEGRELFAPAGHASTVTRVSFTPDARHVLSRGDDCALRRSEVEGDASAADGSRAWMDVLATEHGAFALDRSEDLWRLREERFGAEAKVAERCGVRLARLGERELVTMGTWTDLHDVPREPSRLARFELPDLTPLASSRRVDHGLTHGAAVCARTRRIAATGSGGLALLRADDGAPIAELALPEGAWSPTGAIAFAGRAILVGTFAGTVAVLDEDGGPPALLDPGLTQPAAASSIAIVPGRARAVVGHADGVLRIWDLDAREVLACWRGHEAEVRALACSRDGALLASGSEDTTVAIWRLA